jgi:hypothetical protein
MKQIDVSGHVFGRLTVKEIRRDIGRDSRAVCECACGGVSIVLVYNLRNGNTSSCGCLAREVCAERGRIYGPTQGKRNITHGMSNTPTYVSWIDARKRCFNPKNKRYAEYGGRGVTMCLIWAKSFEAFYADMGTAPACMTLERKNTNGNYEPGNCKWASRAAQAQNTRRTKATWEIVREMRTLYRDGESVAKLSAVFGMSNSNAKYIVSGVTWKE